jgi:acetyl esterase/lipase
MNSFGESMRRRIGLGVAIIACLLGVATSAHAGELKIVPLYNGVAPGSEKWKQQERELKDPWTKQRIIVNVVKPTLTVVRPEAEKANGSAVVICPGGGFTILSIESEGLDAARFLAGKGVTCFVLKYRLIESKTESPFIELLMRKDFKEVFERMFKTATDDGLAAMRFVREHAKEYGVDPKRTGVLGFSAGGMVAAAVALRGDAKSRPAFAGVIYGAYDLAECGDKVHKEAPPLFLTAAQDDPLKLAPTCVALYQAWAAADKPAELHVYMKGGHGFGMNKQGLPIDAWAERFIEWLTVLKVLKK